MLNSISTRLPPWIELWIDVVILPSLLKKKWNWFIPNWHQNFALSNNINRDKDDLRTRQELHTAWEKGSHKWRRRRRSWRDLILETALEPGFVFPIHDLQFPVSGKVSPESRQHNITFVIKVLLSFAIIIRHLCLRSSFWFLATKLLFDLSEAGSTEQDWHSVSDWGRNQQITRASRENLWVRS